MMHGQPSIKIFQGIVLFPSGPRYLSVFESAETCCGAHPLMYSEGFGSQLPASENDHPYLSCAQYKTEYGGTTTPPSDS